MAKKKAASEFRVHLSEKIMDLGNYIAVGFIIGQFATGGRAISPDLIFAGFFLLSACYIVAFMISL